MRDPIELKSYEVLKNDPCLNRWVKYFYECELYKKMLKSHQLDTKKDRYYLTDSYDEKLFEEKRKLLYMKFIDCMSPTYKKGRILRTKKKIMKLNLKMLRAMYLITQNSKIYRYGHRFGNHKGFKKEVFDVDTQS